MKNHQPRRQSHHATDKNTMAQKDAAQNNKGASLGFEAELFKAADKLRGTLLPKLISGELWINAESVKGGKS